MQTPVASLTALRFTHSGGLATPTYAHEAESGSLSLRLTSSPFDGLTLRGMPAGLSITTSRGFGPWITPDTARAATCANG